MTTVHSTLRNVVFNGKKNTSLLYEHQVDEAFLWIDGSNDDQISSCIKHLFTACSLPTKRYFVTILEPLLHRDYIYHEYELIETPFKTISSFVTREKLKKIEQEIRGKKKDQITYHRLRSAHLSSEDDVDTWSRACILPSIKPAEHSVVMDTEKTNKCLDGVILPKVQNKTNLNHVEGNCCNRRAKSHILRLNNGDKGLKSSLRRVKSVPLFSEVRLATQRRHMQDASLFKERRILTKSIPQKHSSKDSRKNTFNEKILKLVEWFSYWTRSQQEDFLRIFVNKLKPFQLYYVYAFLMVRLSSDFVQVLPELLALKIFQYLKPVQLKICCKVSPRWRELCSSNFLWEKICAWRNIPLLNQVSFMKAYYYNKTVENNWVDSKPIMTEVSLHQNSILTIDVWDGYIFATGGTDKIIKVWDSKIGWTSPIAILEGHQKAVWDLKFLSRIMLISCSGDHLIKIWNLERSVCVRNMNGHENAVWCLKLVGDSLFSGSADRTVKIWNLRSGKTISTLAPHPGGVYSIDISPDGSKLFAGTIDKTIRVWDLATPGVCLETLHIETSKVASLPIINLSTALPGYLFSCCANSFQIWNAVTGKIVKILKDIHKERITSARLLTKDNNLTTSTTVDFDGDDDENIFDDAKIVTASKDGKLRIWKLHSNTPIQNLSCNDVGNVTYCTRTHLYVGTHSGSLKILSFA